MTLLISHFLWKKNYVIYVCNIYVKYIHVLYIHLRRFTFLLFKKQGREGSVTIGHFGLANLKYSLYHYCISTNYWVRMYFLTKSHTVELSCLNSYMLTCIKQNYKANSSQSTIWQIEDGRVCSLSWASIIYCDAQKDMPSYNINADFKLYMWFISKNWHICSCFIWLLLLIFF